MSWIIFIILIVVFILLNIYSGYMLMKVYKQNRLMTSGLSNSENTYKKSFYYHLIASGIIMFVFQAIFFALIVRLYDVFPLPEAKIIASDKFLEEYASVKYHSGHISRDSYMKWLYIESSRPTLQKFFSNIGTNISLLYIIQTICMRVQSDNLMKKRVKYPYIITLTLQSILFINVLVCIILLIFVF